MLGSDPKARGRSPSRSSGADARVSFDHIPRHHPPVVSLRSGPIRPRQADTCIVFQDGGPYNSDQEQAGTWNEIYVFDNLIAAGQMPVTIGIFIGPGELPPKEPGGKPVSNRSVEYDTYDRFLLEEILSEVAKQYHLTDKAEERAVCGARSGGICAFKVTWEPIGGQPHRQLHQHPGRVSL